MSNPMTDALIAPWSEMHSDAKRRVDDALHDIFWVKDYQSRYGLMLRFPGAERGLAGSIRLRGLTTVERVENDLLEVYLLLNQSEDLELFTALCGDLIKTSSACAEPGRLFNSIINRLHRWQRFLGQSPALTLSEQVQMGLFSELCMLLEQLAPIVGISQAIKCWTGPDKDKQDFSFDKSFVEVKSLVSSKGPAVTISSLHQLDHSIKPLYLAVYFLSRSEEGRSIEDVIAALKEMITDDELLTADLTDRLAGYGFFEGVTEPPFYRWNTDRIVYYLVNDQFPKITADQVAAPIIEAAYKIDLSRCVRFEIDGKTLII